MSEPAEMNALYQQWLEIPAARLPPNHYALLGIADFESDESIIEAAAKSRSAYLHQIASGPQRKIVQAMLGKVAIARRTLLSDETRIEYEQSLRSRLQPKIDVLVPERAGSNQRSETSSDPVLRRRSKASDWKYHAASAAVLLAIVAVVFWMNRNPGGRRASQARLTETAQPQSLASSDNPDLASHGDTATAVDTNEVKSAPITIRKANARQAPAADSSKNSASPIVKRRETGSGLSSGLGDQFSTVLADIANQPAPTQVAKPKDSASAAGFRPLGGLSIGTAKKSLESPAWLNDLVSIADFPSHLKQQEAATPSFETVELPSHRIQIKASKTASVIKWSDDAVEMQRGTAIAITTSLAAAMRSEIQVGFEIDGIQIGIRPHKNGIEVFARDRDPNAPVDSVLKMKTAATQSIFSVRRDPDALDSIHWVLQSGDQLQSGIIDATSVAESAPLTMFIAPPKSEMDRDFWLSDWKSSAANIPQDSEVSDETR